MATSNRKSSLPLEDLQIINKILDQLIGILEECAVSDTVTQGADLKVDRTQHQYKLHMDYVCTVLLMLCRMALSAYSAMYLTAFPFRNQMM